MFKILSSALLGSLFLLGTGVVASELDRDPVNVSNPELQGTFVLRVDQRDNSASMLEAAEIIGSPDQARDLVQRSAGQFAAVPAERLANSELDLEAGASSWFWCWCNRSWHYPTFGWGGRQYRSYYSYSYNYYTYYFYGSYRRWWW